MDVTPPELDPAEQARRDQMFATVRQYVPMLWRGHARLTGRYGHGRAREMTANVLRENGFTHEDLIVMAIYMFERIATHDTSMGQGQAQPQAGGAGPT